MLDEVERLLVYTGCLNRMHCLYESEYIGLCDLLHFEARNLFIKREISELPSNANQFIEIMKHAPLNTNSSLYEYWFPLTEEGRKERIKILKTAIEELTLITGPVL